MNLKLFIILMFGLFIISACSYKVPSYTVTDQSENFTRASTKLKIVQQKSSFDDDGSILCRLSGTVKLPNDQTFSQYITDALKQELQSARRYDENSKSTLEFKLKNADFSSAMGSTNWYIDGEYAMNGEKFFISTVYHDRSSYLGTKACNNVALYFRKAVAQHLRQVYNHPVFTQG